ncbi:hypothetical protein MHH33_05150 [Paenisporosarcina sp. FSL H8-0542]
MEQFLNLIDYLKCGKETFTIQSYFDGKKRQQMKRQSLKIKHTKN